MITAGTLTALAILFLLIKIGLRKCLYFDKYIDVATSVGISVLMGGTYSGIMAGIMAGLVLSVMLASLKWAFGYEKPTKNGWVSVNGRIA